MLEVEFDIFSGMPNPTWVLSHEQEAELFERVSAEPEQLTAAPEWEGRLGLGYRGLLVRRVKTDEGPWEEAVAAGELRLPDEFRVGYLADATAEWLVTTAETQGVEIDDELREAAAGGVQLVPPVRGPSDPAADFDPDTVEEAEVAVDAPQRDVDGPHETWWACWSNYFWANAYFFNDPAHVRRNNCYCFGSNHRSGVRYARPGRRGGKPATSITCGGVIDGLRADGWTPGCQTRSLTIALVIWPHRDYHFYRLVTGGPFWWWGHKPGGTPAKYTDDCGNPIYQYQGKGYAPNNICRGSYTDFCDYFYQDNWTAYVA